MSTGSEYRLGLSVTSSSGQVYRWGPGEPDGRNVPQDLEFSTSLPGGFRDCRCSLFREINRENPDNVLFDDVRVYGPGNETAWEGRFAQFPRQTSQAFTVEPGAVGWSAHLNDDPSFSEVYVDRDLSGWGDPSRSRQIANAATWNFGQWQISPDTTNALPALVQTIPASSQSATKLVESVYDAGPGVLAAAVYYDFVPTNLNSADANWNWHLGVASDDAFTATTDSGNLRAASGSGYFTPATARRYVYAQLYYAIASTFGVDEILSWRKLAVYGNHGLTKRDTSGEPGSSATDPDGFYASDVIANIVTRTAPLLNYTTGAGGSIEPSTFVIPHLTFQGVTGSEAVSRVSAFGTDSLVLPEWGVYENKTFFWRTPDPDRLCWQARIADGAHLSLEGDQADDLYNGVVVIYQDPSGKRSVVGPPAAYWYNGTALADATDTSLVDTSTDNPVNAHGIPRKWAKLELSNPTTQAGAIQLGAVFLAVQSQPQRRGQISLTGTVTHPTISAPQPVWKIRAGDYISVPDSATPEIQRRIIETRYTNDNRELVATIDNTPMTIEGLLEQIGASLTGRIT